MSTRKERQQQKTRLKKKLRNPLIRRIAQSELDRGRGTEVYRLDDDGTGQPLFFNISAMQEWAKENCETFAVPLDRQRAAQLLESGAVDFHHIMTHTVQQGIQPIIICRGVRGGDQIIDGAHRFVAACAAAEMIKMEIPIPGYVLQPQEWRRFVIPESVAAVFCKPS